MRTLVSGTMVPGGTRETVTRHGLVLFLPLASAATFTDLAAADSRPPRGGDGGAVAGVVDGAEWCQAFLDTHCPQAVRSLDLRPTRPSS